MTFLSVALGFAALGLLVMAITSILKGRLGAAVVLGAIAVFIGGGAGAIAAYA